MKATTISLVRHGTVLNPTDIYYGRLPGFSISDVGRAEAATAGQYLRDRRVAAIYHSPMLRAEQTARIILDNVAGSSGHKLPLISCDILNEVHTPFDGGSTLEMERRGWDFYTGTPPPFEQPQDVLQRLRSFFAKARLAHSEQHVIGVTHADPIAFAVMWASGVPLVPARRHFLAECGITDGYPVPASITSFTFPDATDGQLPSLSYHNPHIT